jgi:MFS family permease
MIVTLFPEPKDMAKAIGVYGFVASAGGSIGLLAGGVLTSALNWHWIFFVNLPVGVATGFFALRLVARHDGLGLSAGADVRGASLLTGGLMLGVYTILQVEHVGWTSLRTLGMSAVAVALVAAFVARQGRVDNPLMPLRLFRSRNVAGANVVQALTVVGMFGMFFLGALYLQQVLGYDALGVGLAFLPATVVMGAMSLRFGAPIAGRLGAQRTVVASLLIIAAGLALFAHAPVHGHFATDVVPPMLLIGFGAGLAFPALMQLAMSGATPEDSGLASGLVNTTVQVGGAIGLAVLSTLAAERSDGLRAHGSDAMSALNSGYHLAYLIGALLAVTAALIAAVTLRAPAGVPVGEPELAPAAA